MSTGDTVFLGIAVFFISLTVTYHIRYSFAFKKKKSAKRTKAKRN